MPLPRLEPLEDPAGDGCSADNMGLLDISWRVKLTQLGELMDFERTSWVNNSNGELGGIEFNLG